MLDKLNDVWNEIPETVQVVIIISAVALFWDWIL